MDPMTVLMSWNPLDWISTAQSIKQSIDLMIFGFKIVILLFIVQFVRSRFGGGPIVSILILVLGYIFLEYMWPFFGTLMFIYLFIAFGFIGLLFDLVIAKPWARGGGEEEGHMTGKQYVEELAKRKAMRGRYL
jgi:hypothetical protein